MWNKYFIFIYKNLKKIWGIYKMLVIVIFQVFFSSEGVKDALSIARQAYFILMALHY